MDLNICAEGPSDWSGGRGGAHTAHTSRTDGALLARISSRDTYLNETKIISDMVSAISEIRLPMM